MTPLKFVQSFTLYCCDGGGDAPSADPNLGRAALMQSKTAREALDWYKTVYTNDIAPQAKEAHDMAMQVANAQLEDRKVYNERSQKSWDNWQSSVDEAKTIGTAVDQERAAGRVAADTEQQAGIAASSSARRLTGLGIKLDPAHLAELNKGVQLGTVAAKVGGMNNAREAQRDKGVQARLATAGISANLSGSNQAGATAAGSSAAGNASGAVDNTIKGANFMGSGYSNFSNMNSTAGSMWGNEYGARLNQFNADSANSNAMWGGLGNVLGMMAYKRFADGGELEGDAGQIQGQGTGVSDSVPAVNVSNGQAIRVSNGEYIIPADVVAKKGTEFFDKLVQAHHTPAAIQRSRGEA